MTKTQLLLFHFLLVFLNSAFAANTCDGLPRSWQGEGRYVSPYLAYLFDAQASFTRENGLNSFRFNYTAHGDVENGNTYSYQLECENGFLSINDGPVQGEGAVTGTRLVLKLFDGTGYTFLRLK
ncbi:hypothetical protein B1207_00875 [Legionella quinlivanii]|uniref:Uncharacterized protein n=1 Tax=Legionella quinlivanii TaxID=45073 RepID=A0A364LN31_9GAMM|nr:hypothetical protein [Legionella quinlivanii]RAP38474.1 hypothetical protein B1207_00875 [Legionella quinlivanii]